MEDTATASADSGRRVGMPRQIARGSRIRLGSALAGVRTRRAIAGGGPIVVGPWSSEVGFELLYWIPYVRRAFAAAGVPPERVIAISRGGVADWYGDFAGTYVESLDLLPLETIQEEFAVRLSGGGQKQMHMTTLDHQLIERATRGLEGGVRVLHPSLMYSRFRRVWMEARLPDHMASQLAFAPLAVDPEPPNGLEAGGYAVVKAYSSAVLAEGPETAERMGALVSRLAGQMPVVLLTSPAVDDHVDIALGSPAGMTIFGRETAPSENLARQTAAVAGARLLVSTYGGFSYLGPLLGVPTFALYSRDQFSPVHLEVLHLARQQLSELRGEGPETFLLTALDDPGLEERLLSCAR